jgi:hypothetical protein
MIICDAIAQKSAVIVWYGGWRIVTPATHGHSDAGVELVSVFQHDGVTVSGSRTGPKTFAVSKIRRIDLWPAPQIVPAREATDHIPPQGISHVHCHR